MEYRMGQRVRLLGQDVVGTVCGWVRNAPATSVDPGDDERHRYIVAWSDRTETIHFARELESEA